MKYLASSRAGAVLLLGLAGLSGLGGLSGCATPQAALDQANLGVALTGRYEQALQAYRARADEVARARAEGIRAQEALIQQLALKADWNLRVARAAKAAEWADARQQLIDLAEGLASADAAQQRQLAELDARLAALRTALPATAAKLLVVQRALAEMGHELPLADRIKLTTETVQHVRDAVKDQAKAAAQAASQASTPPMP